MSIKDFIQNQEADRQELLTQLHEIIIQNDAALDATIGTMMRSEMIIYNDCGVFKYGLASVKKCMSLHALPMYMSAPLYEKYKELLPGASFQKGCINFKSKEEMPPQIVANFIADCSKIDLREVREKVLKSKAKKG